MFEQSILLDHPTNKSWSVLLSLTGEITLVGIALLIPLIYTQQLPQFHLSDMALRPPAAPIPKPPDVVRTATGTSSASMNPLRPFVQPDFRHVSTAPLSTIDDMTTSLPPAALPSGPVIGSSIFTESAIRIPPPPPARPAAAPSEPIRISKGVLMAKLVKQVLPVYPRLAITARVSGTVQLMGTISRDGTIRNLQVISGPPLLIRAAVDAVQQWIYKPTLLSGEAVEVIAPIEVRFTLNP